MTADTLKEIVKEMDYIYVLDSGRLVHQGTHRELLEENAIVYKQLLGHWSS